MKAYVELFHNPKRHLTLSAVFQTNWSVTLLNCLSILKKVKLDISVYSEVLMRNSCQSTTTKLAMLLQTEIPKYQISNNHRQLNQTPRV